MEEFEVPDSWLQLTLGEIVEYGKADKAEPSEIPDDAWVLELEDIEKDTSNLLDRLTFAERQSKSTKNLFSAGDVLYGKLRPYLNKVLIAVSDGYCTTEILPLKPNQAIDGHFLFYWLKHHIFLNYVESVSHGLNMPRLGTEAGKQAPLLLPPLNEQKRIVAKIEELRERSQKARSHLSAIPNLCNKFRQSVLAAAFRGDLTADWREQNPDVEPAQVLLERIGKELGQNLADVQTEIDRTDDEIPSTWAWAKLKLMIKKIQPGNNFLCPEVPVTETTVGLVKISAVTWGTFNPKETKTVADPSKVDPNLFIQPGDLLVTRANTLELVGASVVVDEIHYKIMLSDKVWRVDILEVDKKYINFYLRSKDGRKEIESRATGNQLSMRNISQNAFRDVVIAIPPIEEQKEIGRQIESCFNSINQSKQAYQETKDYLNQLDRSILAKAFRGELVEQDPNDEPASILLERIRAEREQQTQGKAKKPGKKGQRTIKTDPP